MLDTILLFEPAKKEYQDLVSQIGATYLSAGDANTRLLTINPFRFHKVSRYSNTSRELPKFSTRRSQCIGMSALLEEAIRSIYRDCGWNVKTSKSLYPSSPRYLILHQSGWMRLIKRLRKWGIPIRSRLTFAGALTADSSH